MSSAARDPAEGRRPSWADTITKLGTRAPRPISSPAGRLSRKYMPPWFGREEEEDVEMKAGQELTAATVADFYQRTNLQAPAAPGSMWREWRSRTGPEEIKPEALICSISSSESRGAFCHFDRMQSYYTEGI
ncbi:unnamed protein product [Pleuronectes platessa]|uniref:Uncharacterized protein n=1 Tax=Pleuronectes platessa TaxID=8262 RepID=A0A9N7V894_PLEPL|nr:unnamed protein product [Pleuronectes platessa]